MRLQGHRSSIIGCVLVTVLIIIVLLAANAFYVLAEFAATTVRKSRVSELVAEGRRTARLLLPVVENAFVLDRYVATCQIGITASSLILGAFGQAVLTPRLGPLLAGWTDMREVAAFSTAAAVVLLGLTTAQVILGELVPKSVALQYPVRSALYTAIPMRWSQALFFVFTVLLNGSGLLVLRLFGAEGDERRHIHSPEELTYVIRESRRGGLLSRREYERLREVLELSGHTARELMIPRRRMEVIGLDEPVEKAMEKIIESPYTRMPVFGESKDDVVGILHVKDVAQRYIEEEQFDSLEPLLRPAVVVPETLSADRLLSVLRERRSHQALVVDEFGGVEGLVALEDVVAEVLGDVGDEFKTAEAGPEFLPDGRLRLPGTTLLHDAEQWTGLSWTVEGGPDTVGGYVTQVCGRIPAEGDRITIDGSLVEVERMQDHAVASIVVAPAGEDAAGEEAGDEEAGDEAGDEPSEGSSPDGGANGGEADDE